MAKQQRLPSDWGQECFGAQAAYKDAVAPALKKQFLGRKRFCILEDNDPIGKYSGRGLKAKEEMKLVPLCIPKRSPDLNVLDYATQNEVERRMRKQEQRFPAGKTETRAQFKVRLTRTARNLAPVFIKKSIRDMATRCKKFLNAKDGLFEEGGKKKSR